MAIETEREMSDALQVLLDGVSEGLLDDAGVEEIEELSRCEVRDFVRDGMLTSNQGFTIKMADGSEFQVTVVRSR